jgi:hypothetical protein
LTEIVSARPLDVEIGKYDVVGTVLDPDDATEPGPLARVAADSRSGLRRTAAFDVQHEILA